MPQPSTEDTPTTWQKIASPLDPQRIAGWASVEHPDWQLPAGYTTADVQGQRQRLLFALHISKITNIEGGFALGYLSYTHHAYNVLLVQPVDTLVNGYERVGVGCLFGREIDQGYERAVQREVRLV
ncbi:hypothetical protein OQA88_7710 [Cercophora sp. LCS_1]